MGASVEFKRLFLRGLLWDSQTQSITLATALRAASLAKLTETSKGKVLVGGGSGGTTVQFALPSIGDPTASDIAETCSLFLDLLDVIAEDGESYTDEQKVSILLKNLKAQRSEVSDFSGLRV